MGISFRHSAGFGKRMEYNLVGKMLMEGLDVYLPLVDDHGVDCVIKKEEGTFIEIQIKARSKEVAFGDAGLFSAITHDFTPNFYFVFYSERLDSMWIYPLKNFYRNALQIKMARIQANAVFGLMAEGLIGKQERKRNTVIHDLINTVVLISLDFTEGIVWEIRYDEGKKY